jgi:hypothetical protein
VIARLRRWWIRILAQEHDLMLAYYRQTRRWWPP